MASVLHMIGVEDGSSALNKLWSEVKQTHSKPVNESDPRSDVHYLGSSENKA